MHPIMQSLKAAKREAAGPSPRALRRAGALPAVVYGAHQESSAITVDARDFDPVTRTPRHIDFYAITKGEKVEVAIPIEFEGESPAVKAGANLVKVLYELTVA